MTVAAGLAVATPARAQGPPASGSGLSLKFGGYVKVDFIQDFSAIGDTNEFKTNTIPAEGSAAAAQSGGTTIHARETRLNVELRSDSGTGPHFRAVAEGDFFGDRQVDFAGELMWGQRANKDGTKGEAWRFQFAAIYRLG